MHIEFADEYGPVLRDILMHAEVAESVNNLGLLDDKTVEEMDEIADKINREHRELIAVLAPRDSAPS